MQSGPTRPARRRPRCRPVCFSYSGIFYAIKIGVLAGTTHAELIHIRFAGYPSPAVFKWRQPGVKGGLREASGGACR